jgi:hypothetical protein
LTLGRLRSVIEAWQASKTPQGSDYKSECSRFAALRSRLWTAQRGSEFEQMIHNLIIKVCYQINREQDGAKRMKLLNDLVSLLRKQQAAIKQKIDSEMRNISQGEKPAA